LRLGMPGDGVGTRRIPERLGTILLRVLGVGPRDDVTGCWVGPKERPTGHCTSKMHSWLEDDVRVGPRRFGSECCR
jgi:hypothetical protein